MATSFARFVWGFSRAHAASRHGGDRTCISSNVRMFTCSSCAIYLLLGARYEILTRPMVGDVFCPCKLRCNRALFPHRFQATYLVLHFVSFSGFALAIKLTPVDCAQVQPIKPNEFCAGVSVPGRSRQKEVVSRRGCASLG